MLPIDVFRQTARNHHFELQAARLHQEGRIKIPMYLSLGTEHVPPSVLAGLGEDGGLWKVFTSHRCHSWFLTFGGDPLALFRELLGRKDGCNGGYGGSASVSVPGRVFGHDGLLGSNAPIAVGFAAASNVPTICVLGDAACEEDYVLGALGHVASCKAPVLFVVEDNGLSIKTETAKRRKWDIETVADAFNLNAYSVDKNEMITETIRYFADGRLPALLNVRVTRCCDHAGSGGLTRCERYEEMRTSSEEHVYWDRDAMYEMFRLAQQAESNDETELDQSTRVLRGAGACR